MFPKPLIVLLACLAAALGQITDQKTMDQICNNFASSNAYGDLTESTMISPCIINCTYVRNTTQDRYDYTYGKSGINSQPSTVTIIQTAIVTFRLNKLESCGADSVCYKGNCMTVTEKYENECKNNVAEGAFAVESQNPCTISCVDVESVPQYPYSYSPTVRGLGYHQLNLPNRMICGDKMMCWNGTCLEGKLFPNITC